MQLIKNAVVWLVFNLHKFLYNTLLLHTLHWLPLTAQIQFKNLVLAYYAANGSGPSLSYISPSQSTMLCYCWIAWDSLTMMGAHLIWRNVTDLIGWFACLFNDVPTLTTIFKHYIDVEDSGNTIPTMLTMSIDENCWLPLILIFSRPLLAVPSRADP